MYEENANYADEFIKGFQVFDKVGNGFIGAGELRYVLTQLGEKMSDEEVDELLKGFPVQYVHVHSFFSSLLRPGLFFYTVPCSQCSMDHHCPRNVTLRV